MLKMIFKDLRISPLRNILTSISMLVGIIAMIGSFLVGTLGKDYLISVNAQMYGWTPTYSYSITDSDFQDSIKMEEFFYKIREIDDCVTITFDMRENIRFAPIISVSSLQGAANDIYKKVVPVDVVLTTTAYNKIYNLPMSSGSWFSYSETEKSLCMVVNKEAESYFNTPYAVGNTDSSLSLTPFNVTGTVNDGKDIPTVYLDAQAVEEFLPNMWQVQNASVYWHLTKGLTTNQMYSSLDDILQDTIGGHIEYSGRSDIGDAYDSVLSMLQLGLLIGILILMDTAILGKMVGRLLFQGNGREKHMKKPLLWICIIAVIIVAAIIISVVAKNNARWVKINDIKGYADFSNTQIEKITLRKSVTSPEWAVFRDDDLLSQWEAFFKKLELKRGSRPAEADLSLNGGGLRIVIVSTNGKEYSFGIWQTSTECIMELGGKFYITNSSDSPFDETYDEAIARHGMTTPWD